jgi:hypothetical protein
MVAEALVVMKRPDKSEARADEAVSLIRPLAVLCGGLGVLSLFWPDWIEVLTGYDPDQRDGTGEWFIVIVLLSTATYWRFRRRAPNGFGPDDI